MTIYMMMTTMIIKSVMMTLIMLWTMIRKVVTMMLIMPLLNIKTDVMKLTNDPALLEEMAALLTDVNVDSFILTQFSTEEDVPQERVKKKRSAAKGEM